MITEKVTLKVDKEIIAGSIISKDDVTTPPKFVFLHGAGTGIKEGVHSISSPIVNNGINILTLDFSGHGESTGNLKQSSLEKRVNEAKEVIDKFTTKHSLIICGVSMGGFVAIKMLDLYKVDTLILFCPALYDSKAYHISFDQGFTEIIRATESWRNTDVLNLLENFRGNLLIVVGEKDEVIPPGVIDLIIRHSSNAKNKELYIIPGCPHKILTWILSQEEKLIKLHQKIMEFS
jgi:pimeloyl-ACP methyl ester carboxylesterase